MDKTSFWWVGLCGICHTGGGPAEFDRDGELYYDVTTDTFGYEMLGLTSEDVELDGDYSEINTMNGELRHAPWDVTGVAEADCLYCHRTDRVIANGRNMNWIWRTATLRGKDRLQDSVGGSVPAYAAAATASQGWFSALTLANTPPGVPPMAQTLEIDYTVGVANGSLVEGPDGIRLGPGVISRQPSDYACWGCHVTPDLKKRGREWFNPASDVHYAGFNHLTDGDPDNDLSPAESKACTRCHPASIDHNFAKGNATLGSVQNESDYDNFRTCAGCHLEGPDRDPEAPAPQSLIHQLPRHREVLACETCHIPYKEDPADLVVDNAVTGATVSYSTSVFLSSDPNDPAAADKSRWHPSFVFKEDADGEERLFPVKLLLSVWWGDWDRKGTEDLSDDVIAPIALWRVRQITQGAPLVGTTDDNGDGNPEVNRPEEIAAYIAALRGPDRYGEPVALEPVLVKGGRVWHDDGDGGVASFAYEGTGIKTESSHPFSVNHNVLPPSTALGADFSCDHCHRELSAGPTPVFDREVLIDPYGTDGQPIYETVSEITGLDP